MLSRLCESDPVGETPLRQGVRGEALVKHDRRGLEARVGEVGVELGQVLRHHHALVNEGAGREARDVERRITGARLLGEPPRHEQATIERRLIPLRGTVDEQLLDQWQRLQGLEATGVRMDWHRAPASGRKSLLRELHGECRLRRGRLLRVVR